MGRKIFQSERMVSSGFLDRHAPTHTNRLLRQKDIKVILLPENVRGLYPWSYIAVFYELVTGILTLFHRMQLPPSFHVEYLVARDEHLPEQSYPHSWGLYLSSVKPLMEEGCYSGQLYNGNCHFMMATVRPARGLSDLVDSLLASYIYLVDTWFLWQLSSQNYTFRLPNEVLSGVYTGRQSQLYFLPIQGWICPFQKDDWIFPI